MASKPEANEIETSTELIVATTQSTSTVATTSAAPLTSSSTAKPNHFLVNTKNPRMKWRSKVTLTTTTARPAAPNTLHPKPAKHEPQTSENALQKTLDYNIISEEDVERNESAVGVVQRTSLAPTTPMTTTTTTEQTTTPEPSNSRSPAT